jgi:hypothetical protein
MAISDYDQAVGRYRSNIFSGNQDQVDIDRVLAEIKFYKEREAQRMRTSWSPVNAILARLMQESYELSAKLPGLSFVDVRKVGAIYAIYVITGEGNDAQPVLMQDEGDLFPSDQLITKLRLLIKN